eukprot:NODE_1441_length_619_cov_1329.319298_g1020_i1.p1 GENE.NODE_1441_length_619_cov_1329.319298_g1020_i1~~NODE_1441_length_619_cov_1329.319298_g1020_i1.p1  ORF type:complete len:140 (-),score=38.48 NODE_1441_length_619_cov_1329.319298_g1020_i1:175-594(-)
MGLASAPVDDTLRGTVLCRHWARGKCEMGDTCSFQHPPAMQGSSGGESMKGTVLCRHWAKGGCALGSECNFAHPQAIVHMIPTELPGQRVQGQAAHNARFMNPAGRSQTLCRHWARGHCQMASQCQFAHPYGMNKPAGK